MAKWPSSSPSQITKGLILSLILIASLRITTQAASIPALVQTGLAISSSSLAGSLRRWSSVLLMVGLCLACGIGPYFLNRNSYGSIKSKENKDTKKAGSLDKIEDPPLLKKHSTIKSYTTSSFTYPAVRTFLHPHPQSDKLPKEPGPLPLLVFIHGLGGSVAQFALLLSTMVNIGPCLGIDLPGCGLSELSPKNWNAYTHEALTELLEVAVQRACDTMHTREVLLIGHSMGCSFSVSLALSSKRHAERAFKVKGVVAVCPKISAIPANQVKIFRRLLNIPTPIFNAWRSWDQRGGIASASVTRFVGEQAHADTKKLQLNYNRQSRTETFRRIARGVLPLSDTQKGLPGPREWSHLDVPIFAIAGESDVVTLPKEITVLIEAFSKNKAQDLSPQTVPVSTPATPPISSQTSPLTGAVSTRSIALLKTAILPAPASHGLIYDLTMYRTLSGLIQDFIANQIDHRLSLGWQLQCLKESNKWDVKNLAKWQAVSSVSEPIAGVFYALKTLREVDEVHSPEIFTKKWASKIKAIIDISYESPVYNPQGLEEGKIAYHKHPTVSKVPPTTDEVRDFISLVDRLRGEGQATPPTNDQRLIGIHCHYGFNRTGFFVCTYLIERLAFSVQEAIDEFQRSRPPGIRHEHFLDTLFVRYCAGLERAPIS